MSQSNELNEKMTWLDAMQRYNTIMIVLENIRAMASSTVTTHRIKKWMTLQERTAKPNYKTITECTSEEILSHVTRMEEDLNKIYGFIKQIIEKQ